MVAVECIKILLLFKVIFQQIVDSFLELPLRRNAGGFWNFTSQRKKNKEDAEQNRFLKSG